MVPSGDADAGDTRAAPAPTAFWSRAAAEDLSAKTKQVVQAALAAHPVVAKLASGAWLQPAGVQKERATLYVLLVAKLRSACALSYDLDIHSVKQSTSLKHHLH